MTMQDPCVLAVLFAADTYLYVPPRRYVFSGAEAYGQLIEDDVDDSDDDSGSSVVSADNDDKLNTGECSNNHPCTSSYPPTPPDLALLDSSDELLDP